VIVCNASPLISLARIEKIDLLHTLYGEIGIPEAVWDEVVMKGGSQPGVVETKKAQWIKTIPVQNKELVLALQRDLDAGESEAIVLALEQKAELLLMDERLGREAANYFGVKCMGVLGILTEAKHKGIIDAIKPLLDLLRNHAGYRISDDLYKKVLLLEKED
jgi:uncharacterized protein